LTFHQRARKSNYNKGCSPLGSRRVAVIGRTKSCAMKASVGLMGTPVGDGATQIQFCSTTTRKLDEPVNLMNSLYYKRTNLQPYHPHHPTSSPPRRPHHLANLPPHHPHHLANLPPHNLITSQTYHLTPSSPHQPHHLTPLSTR